MSLHAYLAFVAATVALLALPGPNVALIVANSVAHGRRYGLITVAGTSAAMAPQLVLTVLSMMGLLALLSHVFETVRWVGVAYLAYLGLKAWRAPAMDLTAVGPEVRSARSTFLRGFLVSLTNPKTLLFYGAFFPQFVTPGAGAAVQLVLLSATFLVLAVVLDGCWAIAADRMRGLLSARAVLRNRLTGACYVAAAAGLAAARRSS